MTRYIIIGIIVLSIIIGLVNSCIEGVSNFYASITSKHEEVAEAIDKGNLSKAAIAPTAQILHIFML